MLYILIPLLLFDFIFFVIYYFIFIENIYNKQYMNFKELDHINKYRYYIGSSPEGNRIANNYNNLIIVLNSKMEHTKTEIELKKDKFYIITLSIILIGLMIFILLILHAFKGV